MNKYNNKYPISNTPQTLMGYSADVIYLITLVTQHGDVIYRRIKTEIIPSRWDNDTFNSSY